MLETLTRCDYQWIGKLFVAKMPEAAKQLLSEYNGDHLPDSLKASREARPETDHKKIIEFFLRFCHLEKRVPEDFTGYITNTNDVQTRRVFVACILHLYPRTFKRRTGLLKSISEVINIDPGEVSQMVQKIGIEEKVYDEFRDRVTEMTTKITAGPSLPLK